MGHCPKCNKEIMTFVSPPMKCDCMTQKLKWEDELKEIIRRHECCMNDGVIESFIHFLLKEERERCLSGNWVATKVQARCADELEESLKLLPPRDGQKKNVVYLLDNWKKHIDRCGAFIKEWMLKC